jgi:tRNA threonylcarbamoyladenosine biosynthesis protein TsaE
MKEIIVKDLVELEKFAGELLREILSKKQSENKATIIALTGDLGAGKTALVQLIAKELGITEIITSPTFSIMKLYAITPDNNFAKLVHMDAYRIEDISELRPLRFEEIINDKNNLICIEWPEKIQNVLPSNILNLSIKILPDESRLITYN